MLKNYLDWTISSQVLVFKKMWIDIKFNTNYEISDTGIIRRKSNKNVLKGCIISGYRSVKLTFEKSRQQRFYVHRLVALHFIPNDDRNKTFVNHKNGNKLDNRVENLEWVTPRENNLHYYQKIQREKKERKNSGKSIPVIQYDLSGKEIAYFKSMNEAKKKTGISLVQIARCVHGEIKQASGYVFKANKGSTTKIGLKS